MDAQGWVLIIGAIGIIIAQTTQMVLSYLRDRDAAEKVEEVKETLATTNTVQDRKADSIIVKLDENTTKTEQVVAQTNGITETLKAEISHLKSEITDLKKRLSERIK